MFESVTAIALLIVFLIPGYIWRSVEGQFVYLDHRLPWEKFALGLLARSTFIYLPFAPWLNRAWDHQWYDLYLIDSAFASIFFIAIYPAFLGLLMGVAQQRDWLGTVAKWRWVNWFLTKTHLQTFRHHRIPTAWEAVFMSNLEACFVVVTRKNGAQIHGLLGPESHISIDPEDRDIFISHVLYFNQVSKKYEFVPGTKGVYLTAGEISAIELIQLPPKKPVSPETATTHERRK
jgi:hypothetical protein